MLLLAGIASPISPIPASEQLCLVGSMTLLAAGVIALVRPRLAAFVAFAGALGQWPIMGGALFVLFFVHGDYDLPIAGFTLPLVTTTAYSFLVLTKIAGEPRGPTWLFPRNRSAWAQRVVASLFAVVGGSILILNLFFIGVPRPAGTYGMTWAYGDDTVPGFKEIRLTYVRYPESYQLCQSDELAKYLETLSTQTVPVTFEAVSDFGHLRGYFIKEIGPLKAVTPVKQNWGFPGVRCDGGGYEKRTAGGYHTGFDDRSLFMKNFVADK